MRVRLKRERLARRLAESRLSQTAWARRLDISPGFLSRLLSGRRPYPGPATRRKLLEGLGMEFDELFEVVGPPPRTSAAGPVPRVSSSRREAMVSTLVTDALLGLRVCRRQPSLAAVTILTVALGIGVTTSMFTLVHGVLLKPLAMKDPDSVMVLTETRDGNAFQAVSVPNFLDWRRELKSFSALAAIGGSGRINMGDPPQPVLGRQVSVDYFEILGQHPLRGRTFIAEDHRTGSARVAVLSESAWRGVFGADAGIVGRVLTVAGTAYMVVGVVSDLQVPSMAAQIYVPLNLDSPALNRRGRRTVSVIGRLVPGATEDDSQAELSALAATLAAEHPGANLGWGARLESLTDSIVGDSRRPLTLLFAAVGLLLLMSCVNVAGLGLSRAVSRGGELSLRSALGAGRGRILRQLIAENLAVTAVGGLLGAGLAWLLTDSLLAMVPVSVPRLAEVGPDGAVLAFAVGVTLLVGLFSGTIPALATAGSGVRTRLSGVSSSFTETRRQRGLHRLLVTGELALAVTMLIGAGLFLRTFASLMTHDLGFRSERAISFQLSFPASSYEDAAALRSATDRVLEQLEAMAGVSTAAAVSHLPLSGANMTTSFQIEGRRSVTSRPSAGFRMVTPGYFGAMGMRIERGRGFSGLDHSGSPPTVLINAAAARTYWPDSDPLGRRISFETRDDEPVWVEIVGIVSDVKHFGPAADPSPEIYQSHLQADAAWRWVGRFLAFVAHSRGEPPTAEQIRELVSAQAPEARLGWVQTLDALLWSNVEQPRFRALLLAAFGASGLLLASVGVYALTTFQLRRRRREIGIRVAIGAPRRRVIAEVLKQTLTLVAAGSAIGLAGAWALQGLVRSFLFEVSSADPLTYVAAPLVLAAVAAAAVLFPASRASLLDARQLRE